jgi:hypothetical protein
MFVEAMKLEMADTVTKFMSHKVGEERSQRQIDWLLVELFATTN